MSVDCESVVARRQGLRSTVSGKRVRDVAQTREDIWVNSIVTAISTLGAALLSGGGVFFGLQYMNKLREKEAEDEANDVVRRAKLDAENFRREAEIELKEKGMRQKEELENEKRAARAEQNEKERQLDKRQDALDQQADELRKQEKAVESTRRELNEKIARQTELNAELEQKIAAQDQVLYDLANLSKEEAKEIVLNKLDQELIEEQGALILKHEKKTAERCEEQARETLLSAFSL